METTLLSTKMELRLDLNLQRMAMISWSAQFWNQPNIYDEIREIFLENDIENLNIYSSIKALVDVAKEQLKAINLPRVICDGLIQTIISSGLRILSWYYDTSSERFSVPCRYTRAFHWTCFGTVDEAKIVKNDWLPRVYILNREEEICDIFYMACTSVLKNFINLNAKRILDFSQKRRFIVKERKKADFIVRSVLTLANLEDVSIPEKNKLTNRYFKDLEGSKEAYMFSLSVQEGHFIAARYYWQHLNLLEKEKNVRTAAVDCLKKCRLYPDPCRFYLNNYVDILIFILTQMSERQRDHFFSDKFNETETAERILNELMNSCAWEDYFFTVFDVLEDQMEDEEFYHYNVLKSIIGTLHNRRKMGLDSRKTIYNQMFSVVWGRIRKLHPADNPYTFEENKPFVRKIFKIFDLDIINSISNNYEVNRKRFLLAGESQYKKLIKKNRFELLEQFMETVLKSDDEREWFKKRIRYFYYFIRKGKFNVANNLLDWLSASDEEERTRIKYKIDFLSLCAKYFILQDFKFATKILSWGFVDEEEKDEYINSYDFGDLKWFHLFWRKDKDNFIISLSMFLKWFFGSESEDVRYKVGEILTEEVLRKSFTKFNRKLASEGTFGCSVVRNALETLDQLMQFSLSPQDIIRVKADICENVSEWFLYLSEEYRCWGSLDVFLNWALGCKVENFHKKQRILDHKKKRELVKNFLLSVGGLAFFKMILMSYYDNFKRYLRLWIDWAGGIHKLENHINELDLRLLDEPSYVKKNYEDLKLFVERFKRSECPYKPVEHHCFLTQKIRKQLPNSSGPRRRCSSFSSSSSSLSSLSSCSSASSSSSSCAPLRSASSSSEFSD